MTKCVVEGCGEEYDVTCSFSFYNVNTVSDTDNLREEWIDGALQEDSECLWRHVSLQLCAYHFESDQQGLWIESPVLPELLTVHSEPDLSKKEDLIKLEHNYSAGVPRCAAGQEGPSRLNVRQLVDTLGYLSLKNLQRKQLWVVNVEGAGAEASVTQAEQVITKMPDPAKQIIEIIPSSCSDGATELAGAEVLEIMEETTIPDNFIYEIAEEQEVASEEVREIPYVKPNKDWTVNVGSDATRSKYSFIKHTSSGKKRRHFQTPDNLYILPDADPSVGIEITTSYEPDSFVVDDYQHLVLQEERPGPTVEELEPWDVKPLRRKKKSPVTPVKRIKREHDWEPSVQLETPDDDEADRKMNNRVRRKNKKYAGLEFVT